MAYRRYTEDDKASALAALDANGGNTLQTARNLGIPQSTLRLWTKIHANGPVAEKRDEKKVDLADKLEELAYKLVDALPVKLAEANYQQAAVSLGIVIDKMQLLRGKPTNINKDDTKHSLDSKLAAFLQRHRGEPAPGGSDASGEN